MINKYRYQTYWCDIDKLFIGKVAEFPSLAAHGDTPEQALSEIKKVVALVIEDLEKENEEIPQPYSTKEYSGKINLRMPKDLHRELVIEAEKSGVSLNQYILCKISK